MVIRILVPLLERMYICKLYSMDVQAQGIILDPYTRITFPKFPWSASLRNNCSSNLSLPGYMGIEKYATNYPAERPLKRL